MNKCAGCGAFLQNTNENEIGYVNEIDNMICSRCFRLKNYGEYQKYEFDNLEFNKILSNIKDENLVIYITDILTLDLSYINKFKRVILAVTKRDIMPKSVKDEKIIASLKNKYPNLLDIILVSSFNNYKIDNLYNLIKLKYNKKLVYLIGNTNSGKSTLLNLLIKNYNHDNKNSVITMSMYPSTTIKKIEIKLNDILLIDTPGFLDNNNYITYLEKADLKKVMPKKEIKPKSCQVKKGHGSILISSYARLDYNTREQNSFVIFTAINNEVKFSSYTKNTYKELTPHKYSISNKDIVIPGIGFIKFTKDIDVTIYLRKEVTPYVRDNLI